MRSFLTTLFLVSIISTTADAQVMQIFDSPAESTLLQDGETRIDATLLLMEREESKAALEAFHAAKTKGTLPRDRNNTFSHQPLGSVVSFNVYNNLLDNNPSWGAEEFELKAEGSSYKLWIEVGELSSNAVSDAQIASLADKLGNSTPAGSIDPNKGVIDNDNDVFGDPPNYDGDGKVDVLVYDIVDGGNNPNSVILGYVISTDINPNAPSGSGNQRDVLYLDISGFSRSGESDIGSTAAHEYQHLILFNYDLRETAFVNEGLSEWAQSINGYPARTSSYLERSSSPTYNVPLFRWSADDVLTDYARASLFTGYFAQRAGTETTGSVSRNRGTGSIGMKDSIPFGSPLTFKDINEDFHIANIVNNASAGPNYVYENEQRRNEVRVVLPSSKIIQGTDTSSLSERTVTLQPGAVEYVQFNEVANINIRLDTNSNSELIREQIRPSVALFSGDGSVEIRRFRPGADTFSVSGTYDKVILICSHTNPDDTSMTITYSADWSASERRFTFVQYDDGNLVSGNFFSISVGAAERINGEASVGFDVPPRYALSRVLIAPFFFSQFTNGNQPPEAPRDLTLTIRGDNAGFPGDLLYSEVMDDPRAFTTQLGAIEFIDIPLESLVDQIGYPLPERIYIGYAEAGTDENWIVAGVTETSGVNQSYVVVETDASGWRGLHDLQLTASDGAVTDYAGTTIPLRASFVFDRAIVSNEDAELPETMSLDQNYPNPFNPTTSISFKTIEPGPVRLSIFDITGRLVDVLYDEFLQSGEHSIGVDATNWASGLYLYELSSGGLTVTKKMTLLR